MSTPSLRHRHRQPEWMDQPDLDEAAHRAALRGLARINRISRSAAALARPLHGIARAAGRPIRVLDLACGGGDVAIALQRRARTARLAITIDGCDLSEVALRHARQAAGRAGLSMRFFQLDALRGRIPDRPAYDVIVSSLFLHHLDDSDLPPLLSTLGRSAAHLLLDDLDRSRLGLLAAQVGTRLLSRSPVVHVDGPRSVRGALTAAEISRLARDAGLAGATVTRHRPCRWLLRWSRP